MGIEPASAVDVAVGTLSTLSPLFTAAVGAVIGVLANGLYRNREEKRNLDQEFKGLMNLIFHEYAENDLLLKWLSEDPSFINAPSFTNLQCAVWTDARVRLAQLLAKEHTGALAQYYSLIGTIRATIRDETMPENVKTKAVLDYVPLVQKYGKVAMLHAAPYIFVDDPTYTEAGHDRFIEEAQRLMSGRNEQDRPSIHRASDT